MDVGSCRVEPRADTCPTSTCRRSGASSSPCRTPRSSRAWPGRPGPGWALGSPEAFGATARPGATTILEPMRDRGWRADAGARWSPAPRWVLDGRYELEWGPGGFLNSADAAVRYAVADRLSASVSLLTFQQIEEYRLGEGRAFGVGASRGLRAEWADIACRWPVHHTSPGRRQRVHEPWDQGRAWTSLRFELGGDPGLVDGRLPQ